jgi:hypothetical protein
MARKGALTLRDIVDRTEYLNVDCPKCGRRYNFHLGMLAERYGLDGKVLDWIDDIARECATLQARSVDDQCGARCLDLIKLFR